MSESDLVLLAAKAIDNSSSVDFESGLKWGQWCRDIIQAAFFGDDERVQELLDQQRSGNTRFRERVRQEAQRVNN